MRHVTHETEIPRTHDRADGLGERGLIGRQCLRDGVGRHPAVALQPRVERGDVLRELAVGFRKRVIDPLAEHGVETRAAGETLREREESVEPAAGGRVGKRRGDPRERTARAGKRERRGSGTRAQHPRPARG
ncbi:hypothetical protein KCU90_g1765, partial [Aureobasidium melanogenum]